jgi:hypothetical protein
MRLRMLRDQGPNRFDILEAEATTLKDSSLAHALFFTPPTGGRNKIISAQNELNCYPPTKHFLHQSA